MSVLKYKDPATGQYIELPIGGGGGGGGGGEGGVDGYIEPGAGLHGGGYVSEDPTLNVGQGEQIQVDADSVRLAPYCTMITNWNAAVTNGWYMGVDASNAPGTSWWYGIVIAHNGVPWCTQLAFPFANAGYDETFWAMRVCANGAWGGWFRPQNYLNSNGTMDNFTLYHHGGNWNSVPVRRWAVGSKKDTATSNPSANDQFRIQRYDTAGNYTGNVMTASTAGAVQFPGGHSLMREARESGEPVAADHVATVGIVADMVVSALRRLGLLAGDVPEDLTGLLLGEVSE